MSAVFPLKDNQALAVAPDRTVWLSASAGTGKTQVLTARVLRLLLEPAVEPEQILCLTFTKAGAAEMATRVSDVLARWVRLDDAKLAAELGFIGADIGPATRLRARSRFAAVLDCPGGGLRIGTIHSFAQWLLAAFPVEAGLTPGTRAMEDRDRDLLARQVLADMLAEAEEQGDAALFATLEMLSLRMTQDQVQGFLMRCAGARELWFGTGAWTPPLRSRINQLIGLPPEDSGDPADIAALCADDTFDCASVRGCMAAQAAWGTAKAIDAASMMGDWLASDPAARLAGIDDFADLFLTKAGEPRKTSALDKRAPGYPHHAVRVIASLAALRERQALAELVAWVEPALGLGRRFALAWDAAKAREGLIDFDDQIRRAAALLNQQDMGEWVRYKLDRQFDHVLVDEAQDTNAAQWDIINALVGDFFTGEGQRGDRLRTLFVVGDYKQAIFRFQGTSPENFAHARDRVRGQLAAVAEAMAEPERALLDLGLARSYRTAAPVHDFVDRAIAAIGPERFGRIEAIDPHMGEDRPGLVAMWNPVSLAPTPGDDEPEGDGEDGSEGWLSRPDRQLADTLARQIRTWMETGFPLLKGRHRLAGPGDVMVLVRKRKELAGLIVARLHAQGVPVAGVDRLRLGAPLAVKDLVAALRFAAQPFDDLNLANLLVSPLIGWSQEDLLQHGWRTGKLMLWEHLRSSEGPETLATMHRLRELLALADRTPPQALLHWLLVGPWEGRKALVARLGSEANDPIDELLNASGAFAASGTPSLNGFLQWFDAGEGELKREQGRAGNQVRVMTVHGAKGLQAPIVILADAVDDPDSSPPRGSMLEERVLDAVRAVPIPPLRKQEKVAVIREAEERAQREEREEHWRLLYVAMTRAEEALFIGGAMGPRMRELPADSWYAQLKPLFPEGSWRSDPLWQERAELGGLAPRPAEPDNAPIVDVSAPSLPDWLTQPIGPEPRPPRPLAPSSLGEEQAPDPPPRPGPGIVAAARRGTLVHKLIERLPERPPAERLDAALAWLARNAADIDDETRRVLAESAVRVLAQPGWEDVFGPDSLAEVPIAALVGGRMVTGAIDRLVIGPDTIRIVDFKTARRPPERIEDIPAAYLRQMAAYAQALGVIHPGVRIEAALLYTETPVLFALTDDLLSPYKLDATTLQSP
ncbi:double-strand break repair helicase AddA [Novosphingobium sp.]|uniref:double-strand break repair helicase AddA n=1 Tax=Novosphingobium sp. TaxID=1874826 RepID=UPI0025E8FE41|nr:double-strand break repair helicase AddA [Novosphingobium sp.]